MVPPWPRGVRCSGVGTAGRSPIAFLGGTQNLWSELIPISSRLNQAIDLCYCARACATFPPTTLLRQRRRPTSAPLTAAELAREQLISHATRIFAAKGYAAATTREICDAAGVNIASIHYYFGDKEGLYRAALLQPIKEMTAAFGRFDDPSLPFEQAMRMFLGPFVAPSTDDLDRDVMRIHLREMMEPSDVFREITEQTIVPAHNLLAGHARAPLRAGRARCRRSPAGVRDGGNGARLLHVARVHEDARARRAGSAARDGTDPRSPGRLQPRAARLRDRAAGTTQRHRSSPADDSSDAEQRAHRR